MSTNATARPSWNGRIQFGLVPIGVKLFPVAGEYKSPFVTVHAACGSPIAHSKRCTKKGCRAAMVEAKAVNVGGIYEILTAKELKRLEMPSRSTIKLTGFPDVVEAVDPLRIEMAYYVQPASDADREAYHALLMALQASSTAGTGKISLRSRERQAVFVPHRFTRSLVCLVMRFPIETRAIMAEMPVEVGGERLRLACEVIAHVRATPPNLRDLCDDYSAEVSALIRLKTPAVAGQGVPLDDALLASAKAV